MEDLYMLSDLQLQQKIGERLKSDRLMQNMTQANLAEDAGVSVSSIKKIEEGKIVIAACHACTGRTGRAAADY